METPSSVQTMPTSPGVLLAKHALLQYGLVLLLLSLFAATDSWQHLTGWPLATVLASIMGLLAGFATTTVLHEWFHWLGAKLSGGTYVIPAKPGLFVYDWDFEKSDVKQFFTMSLGGNIGGLLALLWLASAIETDTVARSALIAGSVASVAFAAAVEWPVLWRTRESREPLAELSKVDAGVLKRALMISLGSGLLVWYLL